MFLKKQKDILGIDIGSSSVKLIRLKERKGSYQLINIGIVPLPSDALANNMLANTQPVIVAIKNLLESQRIKSVDVASALPANTVIIRKLILPAQADSELETSIPEEAEHYIPFDIRDVNIDFQRLSTDQDDLGQINVLLVASRKEIVNNYINLFKEAELNLIVADVDFFALQNAFEINHNINYSSGSVALIDIGANMTNINIVKDGITLFTRDINIGGELHTSEIQKYLGINRDEAEMVKLTAFEKGDPELFEILEKSNETIAYEIQRGVDLYNSSARDLRAKQIFISGGASKTFNLMDAIKRRLEMPVTATDPFAVLKYDKKAFDPEYLREIAPFMVTCLGLAARKVGDK